MPYVPFVSFWNALKNNLLTSHTLSILRFKGNLFIMMNSWPTSSCLILLEACLASFSIIYSMHKSVTKSFATYLFNITAKVNVWNYPPPSPLPVFLTQMRKTSNISQTNSKADRSEDKLDLVSPFSAVGIRIVNIMRENDGGKRD